MPAKPKSTCCVSKPRCKRCPLRMLAEGTLPSGYTVKKRKLVKVKKKKKKKAASGKKPGKKSRATVTSGTGSRMSQAA